MGQFPETRCQQELNYIKSKLKKYFNTKEISKFDVIPNNKPKQTYNYVTKSQLFGGISTTPYILT